MIIKCTCSSLYQDGRYGLQQRVHNPTAKAGQYRCTVCGKINQSTKKEDGN